MQNSLLYIHGKGGSAAEAEHYRPLFPGHAVVGLDYRSSTPWEAGAEIRKAVEALRTGGSAVRLIANSIGALYTLYAGVSSLLERAWFISPFLDMEPLILSLLDQEHLTEKDLQDRGSVPTASGLLLRWDILSFIRTQPILWDVPTEILYGSRDSLTSYATVARFAREHKAGLTVMENCEHWFHTPEQMAFLDAWITR